MLSSGALVVGKSNDGASDRRVAASPLVMMKRNFKIS